MSGAVKARPILFSGPMIRSLLGGRKTQTRRIISEKSLSKHFCVIKSTISADQQLIWRGALPCPYGQPGDLLWVRETFISGWNLDPVTDKPNDEDSAGSAIPMRAFYRATESDGFRWLGEDGYLTENIPWKPSIHMPRWASRLTLEITEVRVQRLQEISEGASAAEGIEPPEFEREDRDYAICPKCGGTRLHNGLGANLGVIYDLDCVACDTHKKRYQHLWNAINGTGSWDANPWVWCLSFNVHQKNIDALLAERGHHG